MNILHLVIGIVLFGVFVTTGQFMRADFPDKESIDQMLRMLMRSRHIYILFSALMHLLLGAYLDVRSASWRRTLQIAGSAILFLASAFLIWAFIAESYYLNAPSDISRFGIYASLGGVALHVIGGFDRRA